MALPFISVIIPTYNRGMVLCNALEALFVQDYTNYEIIVVDQSKQILSSAATFLDANKDKLRYYHLDIACLPGARNFGISKARGDVIMFFDDDFMVGPQFLRIHAENYKDPGIDCVASKRIPVRTDAKDYTLRFTGVKVALSGRVFTNWAYGKRGYAYCAGGDTAFSLRSRVYAKVGKYDNLYIVTYHYEDIDFGYRLKKSGIKVMYEPRAVVVHTFCPDGGVRVPSNVESEYYRFRNGAIFYLRNMNIFFLPYMLLAFFLIGIKKILVPTRSFKKFFYVLKGFWDGFIVYASHGDNGRLAFKQGELRS